MVGAGVTVADLPSYASHNDLGTAVLLAAMHEAGVDRLVVASSMVVYGEGRYSCAEHGEQAPGPRALDALDAGDFENHCTDCGRPLDWETRRRGRPARPAQQLRREQGRDRALRVGVGPPGPGAAVALRYHNVYGPRMPRDTPYSGVAAMFRSAARARDPPNVFEDGGQMRDFVHVADVARANVLAHRGRSLRRPPSRSRAYNVCSGEPIPIRAGRRAGGARAPAATSGPEFSGRYRLGDVRHIVASPERARAELGSRRAVPPEQGLPEFATAPLR